MEGVIYNFTGGSDGCWPEFGSVTIPKSGEIYGTTGAGGSYNQGVVYLLKRSNGTWSETTLYDFTGGNDGGQVFAGVTLDPAGNIFECPLYTVSREFFFRLARTSVDARAYISRRYYLLKAFYQVEVG